MPPFFNTFVISIGLQRKSGDISFIYTETVVLQVICHLRAGYQSPQVFFDLSVEFNLNRTNNWCLIVRSNLLPFLGGGRVSRFVRFQTYKELINMKCNTYKSYYSFLTTQHFIFVIVSSCTVAFLK